MAYGFMVLDTWMWVYCHVVRIQWAPCSLPCTMHTNVAFMTLYSLMTLPAWSLFSLMPSRMVSNLFVWGMKGCKSSRPFCAVSLSFTSLSRQFLKCKCITSWLQNAKQLVQGTYFHAGVNVVGLLATTSSPCPCWITLERYKDRILSIVLL